MQRLIGLDYLSTSGLTERSEGSVTQWAPVFRKSPETWRIVVYRDEVIVGYWSFFSLSDALFARLEQGALHDSEITADNVHVLSEGRLHNLYVVMVTQQPEFQTGRRTIFKLLIKSLSDSIDEILASGTQIGAIYANAFTPDGLDMCVGLGFTEWRDAEQGGKIYKAISPATLVQRLRSLARVSMRRTRRRAKSVQTDRRAILAKPRIA